MCRSGRFCDHARRVRAAFCLLLVSLVVAAPASALIPNDPGMSGQPGGWQADQWNFLPGTGVDAPRAWDNLIARGRPGGLGVKIAVLDTGLAYEDRGPFRRSPDISRFRVGRGYDFCAHSGTLGASCAGTDAHPDDGDGHGTHVASTIAEATSNGVGETGLAYGATLIPVKVLNRDGDGDETSIAAGLRYAADRGAQVINLSFEFGSAITSPRQIPKIAAAVRYARHKGALIVAAAGNSASDKVGYPAALPGVVSVGAVTEHGCLASYSDAGPGLDLVAPGGGEDALLPDQPACRPDDPSGRSILQMTFTANKRTFGLPAKYYGTSMAAPHVTATAALIIASGVLGPKPTPAAIERRLKATARDLGTPGPDTTYGAGMVDAGAATAP
jgi:serine protease